MTTEQIQKTVLDIIKKDYRDVYPVETVGLMMHRAMQEMELFYLRKELQEEIALRERLTSIRDGLKNLEVPNLDNLNVPKLDI